MTICSLAISTREQLLSLVSSPEGATRQELQDALGWQALTVRGFIAGRLRKQGHSIVSKDFGEERRYGCKKLPAHP
jgi:hypothetical protein